MELLRNRWVVAFGGAGVALAAGLIIAWVILSHSHASHEAPPGSHGSMIVVTGRDDDTRLDPSRPLRCFVQGQFVGELPLAVCAQRNGVATGALDVGLDQAGALAATNGASSNITPFPPMEPPKSLPLTEPAANAASNAAAPEGTSVQAAASAQAGACWRYVSGGWRKLPTPMPLPACVQALYAGRCAGPDEAYYGRWDDQTLRLIAGRIELSFDNRDFRPLIDPWPPCQAQPG